MPFTKETAAAAGRIGRKRVGPETARDKSIRIGVTQKEYDMISDKAADKGITKTALIVRAVSDYK